MKILVALIAWFILLAVAWPLALIALVLWPVIWLLSIPFRILGTVLEAILAFIKALSMLPARLLGHKSTA
jgi:hypothetical protein